MKEHVRPALVVLLLLSAVTGLLYPALVTGLATVAFPAKAGGSLIRNGGRVVGSELIGQSFRRPEYFWGRLSATGPAPYNGAASSGSNLSPRNPALAAAASARIADLRAADSTATGPVPVDLVTASGSGLDPHVSPAAAYYQVARVARARGLDPEAVRALVTRTIEPRTVGLLGEPTVSVLRLNLALDAGR